VGKINSMHILILTQLYYLFQVVSILSNIWGAVLVVIVW